MIKFHQSIITKLILISCLILLFVIGIVAAALMSSQQVESLLLGGVGKDMQQMIANAAMRRKLGQVFADTTLLVSTFSEREDFLKVESERLTREILLCRNSLADTGQSERLLPPLEEFIQSLKAILEQAALINAGSQAIQNTDSKIVKQLRDIEQTVIWQEALLMTEENSAQKQSIEKLHRLLPKYQQILLRITVLIGQSKQAYLGVEAVSEPYEQEILELLRSLGANLALLKTLGGEELAIQGEGFLDATSVYKKQVIALHESLQGFQEQLYAVKHAERRLAEVIVELDEQISQSTTQTFVAIAGNIHTSKQFMLGFSCVILLVLLLLGGFTIKILQPLKNLAFAADLLAKGDISYYFQAMRSQDEIGILSKAFQRLVIYMQEMSRAATAISEGNLSTAIQSRSKKDILGNAFLRMIEYVQYTAEITTRISEGDLSQELRLRSSVDTFGQAIQTMTKGLRSLITRIRMSSEQIADTGSAIAELSTDGSRSAAGAGASVRHLNATIERMRESVEEVALNMHHLSSSIEMTSDSISKVTLSIGHIVDNTDILTKQTHQTIEAMTNTLRSIDGVVEKIDSSKQLSLRTKQDAVEGTQAVEQVMSSMDATHQTVMTAVEALAHFSERSQDIDSILDVIRNITEQTTLLALNASIIAAQAGTQGRGFAVVADEIKSLADGVGASTKDIAAIVHALKQDTLDVTETIHAGFARVQQGVGHTQQAREALNKILASANDSAMVVTEIAETLHGLRQTSRNVASSMQEVERMTSDMTTATNEQKTSTEQINDAIRQITDMTGQTQRTTTEQLTGVQQILEASSELVQVIAQNQQISSQITQSTEELSSQAELLLDAVDRFTLPTE